MAQPFTARINGRSLLVAVAAGLGFAMTEMVIEAVSGKGFWAPLRFIASILTRGKDTDPSFSLVPVVVGVAGHMIESVVLGLVFIVLAGRIAHGVIGLAMTGMVYGAILFAASWFVILPPVDPAMRLLNGPGFLVSHLMFGLLLGLGTWLAWERIVEADQVAALR
ncbi:MAG TPA: hypothetical protein VKK19_20295 [Candidatus Dormibacteraeota bacterium]|nr:hypothetical protein [Candidatus Dormibacteraeota bacterium]